MAAQNPIKWRIQPDEYNTQMLTNYRNVNEGEMKWKEKIKENKREREREKVTWKLMDRFDK